MKNTKKLFAFTLAEVLITLAIIGVVAAMTIPILMQNYQKGQYMTAFKKMYSQLTNAVDRVMLDYNVENFNDVTLLNGATADPKAFFKKYFRVSKYCEPADYESCFATSTSIDKQKTSNPAAGNWTCAILKDGASICLDPMYGGGMLSILMDTNGLDKPNIGGRDVFKLYVYYDGSIDEINPRNLFENSVAIREGQKGNCAFYVYGGGCFSKIIDSGWKMDY